ncbi:MAG: hypothetical protein WC476_08205, partial [Phycisphaerae bacterium]
YQLGGFEESRIFFIGICHFCDSYIVYCLWYYNNTRSQSKQIASAKTAAINILAFPVQFC